MLCMCCTMWTVTRFTNRLTLCMTCTDATNGHSLHTHKRCVQYSLLAFSLIIRLMSLKFRMLICHHHSDVGVVMVLYCYTVKPEYLAECLLLLLHTVM